MENNDQINMESTQQQAMEISHKNKPVFDSFDLFLKAIEPAIPAEAWVAVNYPLEDIIIGFSGSWHKKKLELEGKHGFPVMFGYIYNRYERFFTTGYNVTNRLKLLYNQSCNLRRDIEYFVAGGYTLESTLNAFHGRIADLTKFGDDIRDEIILVRGEVNDWRHRFKEIRAFLESKQKELHTLNSQMREMDDFPPTIHDEIILLEDTLTKSEREKSMLNGWLEIGEECERMIVDEPFLENHIDISRMINLVKYGTYDGRYKVHFVEIEDEWLEEEEEEDEGEIIEDDFSVVFESEEENDNSTHDMEDSDDEFDYRSELF